MSCRISENLKFVLKPFLFYRNSHNLRSWNCHFLGKSFLSSETCEKGWLDLKSLNLIFIIVRTLLFVLTQEIFRFKFIWSRTKNTAELRTVFSIASNIITRLGKFYGYERNAKFDRIRIKSRTFQLKIRLLPKIETHVWPPNYYDAKNWSKYYVEQTCFIYACMLTQSKCF